MLNIYVNMNRTGSESRPHPENMLFSSIIKSLEFSSCPLWRYDDVLTYGKSSDSLPVDIYNLEGHDRDAAKFCLTMKDGHDHMHYEDCGADFDGKICKLDPLLL